MNRRTERGLVLVIAMLILGLCGYRYRTALVTRMWHWRHGDVTKVGLYSIPVPVSWYVPLNSPISTEIVKTDHRERRPGFNLNSVITVSFVPANQTSRDIDWWKVRQSQWLRSRGSTNLEERELTLDGEQVICLKGNIVRDVMHVPADYIVSVDCHSNRMLDIMFNGSADDVQDFFAIVARIRRAR